MRQSPAIAAALGVALAACAGGTPDRITTVAVAATPCDRPTARIGVGTVVANGLVLTAAHLVEDDLRDVEVDGRPARVLALDTRIDAAVLAVDTVDGRIDPMLDVDVPDVDIGQAVRIVTPTETVETTVTRVVTLSVDDATDGVVYRRDALVLDGAVPAGTSGAPVVDASGAVIGMVAIVHAGRDVTYATRTGELRVLTDPFVGATLAPVTRSSLAGRGPCA